ncbi:hypothetical protein Tco_0969724 [Tanacetum coccineum]
MLTSSCATKSAEAPKLPLVTHACKHSKRGQLGSHSNRIRHAQFKNRAVMHENLCGTEGAVGLTRWVEKLESQFGISNVAEGDRVKFASSTLLDGALTWWNVYVRSVTLDTAHATPWSDFKAMFIRNYPTADKCGRHTLTHALLLFKLWKGRNKAIILRAPPQPCKTKEGPGSQREGKVMLLVSYVVRRGHSQEQSVENGSQGGGNKFEVTNKKKYPQNNQRQNQGNPKGNNQASTSTQGGRIAPGRVYNLCAEATVKDDMGECRAFYKGREDRPRIGIRALSYRELGCIRRHPILGLLILPSIPSFSPTIRRTARMSVLPIEPNLVERARISFINLDDYQLDPLTPPPSPLSPFSMSSVHVPEIVLTVCTKRLRGQLHTILEDMDRYPNACLEELEAFMTLWDVKPRVEENSLETLSVDELITQLRQMYEDAEDHASNAQEEARQKRKEVLEEAVQRIYHNN